MSEIDLLANLIAVTALGGAFLAVVIVIVQTVQKTVQAFRAMKLKAPLTPVERVCSYCGGVYEGNVCEHCGGDDREP